MVFRYYKIPFERVSVSINWLDNLDLLEVVSTSTTNGKVSINEKKLSSLYIREPTTYSPIGLYYKKNKLFIKRVMYIY